MSDIVSSTRHRSTYPTHRATHKWESYENIHKRFDSLDMNQIHTLSLKINGSNLSTHVKFDPEKNEWIVVCLHGRTAPVWTVAYGEPYSDIKYGSAGSLGDLPDKMRFFAIAVAEKLGVQEIIIYGEAFRAPALPTMNSTTKSTTKSITKYASYHPFGYKLPSKNYELHMMTQEVYDLFSSCCLQDPSSEPSSAPASEPSSEPSSAPASEPSSEPSSAPASDPDQTTTNDEFLSFLRVQTATTICPPPILFCGKLSDGIRKLYPILMTRDPNFEGLFIVNEEGSNGFKWKTPIHEEQLKIRSSTELDLLPNTEAYDVYELLLQVCAMRRNAQSKAQSKAQSNSMVRSDESKQKRNEDDQLNMRTRAEIAEAFTNIQSKSPCFEHKSPRERIDVVVFFLPLVVEEVLSHYEDSGLSHHMAKDRLEQLTRSVITPLIMRA